MAEVMRFFAARLREFVVNRRSARRHKMRLPVSVALVASKYVGKQESQNVKDEQISSFVSGYTQDVSETGLSIIVSKIHIEGRYLTDQDRKLLIKLEIQDDIIEFKATAKRHQTIETETDEKGFLIGVAVKDIDEENRTKLIEFLKNSRR